VDAGVNQLAPPGIAWHGTGRLDQLSQWFDQSRRGPCHWNRQVLSLVQTLIRISPRRTPDEASAQTMRAIRHSVWLVLVLALPASAAWLNETGLPGEADYCVLQFPASTSTTNVTSGPRSSN
jgi:hypothetical protein